MPRQQRLIFRQGGRRMVPRQLDDAALSQPLDVIVGMSVRSAPRVAAFQIHRPASQIAERSRSAGSSRIETVSVAGGGRQEIILATEVSSSNFVAAVR
jgi:hypothetical protein